MFETFKEHQSEVKKLIDNSFERKRLSHLYLFVGSQGSLKEEGALYLASRILSDCHGCGNCNNCKKIEMNPYLYVVKPMNDFIAKNQVEDFLNSFRIRDEHNRFFIFYDFDKISDNNANLLLKYLEKIQDNVYGVIITTDLHKILPTIRSRSQVIFFKSLREDVLASLIDPEETNRKKAEIVVTLTSDPQEAKNFLVSEKIDYLIDLAVEIHRALEKQNADPIILYASMGEKLISEHNRQDFSYLASLLITLQNEKLKVIAGSEAHIFEDFFTDFSSSLKEKTNLKILELLLELEDKLTYNVNLNLIFISYLTKIRDLIISDLEN